LALQARGWKPPLLLRAAAQHVRSAAPRAVASTPPCTDTKVSARVNAVLIRLDFLRG
jgi:hypothetical protein